MVEATYKKKGVRISHIWFCSDIDKYFDSHNPCGDIVFFHGIEHTHTHRELMCYNQSTVIKNISATEDELFNSFGKHLKQYIKRSYKDRNANDIYYSDDFFFIPQQSGRAREMKFKVTTFCYHPNTSSDVDFDELRSFIEIHNDEFTSFDALIMNKRSKSLYDKLLSFAYFTKRRLYHK